MLLLLRRNANRVLPPTSSVKVCNRLKRWNALPRTGTVLTVHQRVTDASWWHSGAKAGHSWDEFLAVFCR
jgi:hypothetical protein